MSLVDIILVSCKTGYDVLSFYCIYVLPDIGGLEPKPWLSWANEDLQKELPSDFDAVLMQSCGDHYQPSYRLDNMAKRDKRKLKRGDFSTLGDVVEYYLHLNAYRKVYKRFKIENR